MHDSEQEHSGITGCRVTYESTIFYNEANKFSIIVVKTNDPRIPLQACNGRYYGGGSTPVPEARMTDGILHTVLVRNVSKARFARLFPGYSAGDYKKLPQNIIRVSTAKVVRIEALEGDLTTCLDGESMHAQCVTLKLADKKVNFFAPAGCDPDATAR